MAETAVQEQQPMGFESAEQQPLILQMLEAKWAEGKFLCVGLDVSADESPTELFQKAKLIVDATHDIAAAFKPNSAFYEDETSAGYRQMERLVGYIKKIAPDVPVIWDAKRADIAKTNEGYDHSAAKMGVDGMTIHPYLGGSAVKPLLSNRDRVGFVLAHTSNPGAAEFQHLRLQSGEMLWERVVKNVAHSEEWQHGSVLGIVTGATYPEELARARHLAGNDVVMLIPGIGTQGGDLEASVRGAMNNKGNGFIINVSSGISGAKDETGTVTRDSVRDAAIKYHEQIKSVWQQEKDFPSASYGANEINQFNERLALSLVQENCIKFGDFTLRSGMKSVLYMDLRSAITDPTVRGNIANIYVDLVKGLEARRGEQYDVLGGIPQAATSFAAIVADRMERRLVQPRSGGKKDYGSGNLVDGNFRKGETIGLIDDLITTGGAKLDTIKQVEEAGLVFGGMAMLVDREGGGFRDIAARGLPISAATTARGLLAALVKTDAIPAEYRDKTLEIVMS